MSTTVGRSDGIPVPTGPTPRPSQDFGAPGKYPERECLFCRKLFVPMIPSQVVCSAECRRRRKRALENASRERRRESLGMVASLREEIAILKGENEVLRASLKAIKAMEREDAPSLSAPAERSSPAEPAQKDAGETPEDRWMAEVAAQPVEPAKPEEIEALTAGAADAADAPVAAPSADAPVAPVKLTPTVEKAIEELVDKEIKECPRMKLKGTSLPCGERRECFELTRCANVPEGKKKPVEGKWTSFAGRRAARDKVLLRDEDL